MTNPRQYRGKPIDPKQAGSDGFVYGCLYEFGGKNYITINKPHKKYSTGYETKFLSHGLLIHPSFQVIPSTVGQDTGREDKKQKPIFGGDICYAHMNKAKYVVEHGLYIHTSIDNDGEAPDCYGWYLRRIEDGKQVTIKDEACYGESLEGSDKYLKVIGTIHDKEQGNG